MSFDPPTCSRVSPSRRRRRAPQRLSREAFPFLVRPHRPLNRFAPRQGIQSDGRGRRPGFTLNFDNSPVTNVAKAILGDILGVGYVIDPRAQGTITLSSGRPIDKRDMLFVLENALKANNLILVRDSTGYRIAPANDGTVGSKDSTIGSESADPGYGLTVVPLRYVSGDTLSRLLEGFAARPGASAPTHPAESF